MDQNPMVTEGIRLMQASNFAEAASKFQEVIADNPSDGKAYGYFGMCQVRLGDIPGGVRYLQRAVELQPNDTNALYNLSVALVQAQRHDDARSALQHVLTLDPNHAKANVALANIPSPPVATAAATAMASAPSSYDGPRALDGSPLPQAYGQTRAATATMAPPTQGMYAANTVAPQRGNAPSSGKRIGRGLGWGWIYGQWWTVLNLFWTIVWSGLRPHESDMPVAFQYFGLAVVFMLLFGFVGMLVGLIIGAADADVGKGATIGVVAGLLLGGLEFLGAGMNPTMLVNVFFWFYTGRFVGARIALKVQEPVHA